MLPAYIQDSEDDIRRREQLLRELSIGSLCFFHSRSAAAANISSQTPMGEDERARLRDLIDRYQEAARIPLLIAMDAEWGLAMRVRGVQSYPYALCLGALQDQDELIRRVGRAIGADCREVGIHWNLAPVTDLHLNPSNPVIGYRSFGSDGRQVAICADAYRKGLADSGVLHCLKHFPGHGDTTRDSHQSLPVIIRDQDQQSRSEELPYRLLFRSETDGVMAAHVSFPQLTGKPGLPATLSREVLRDYLRGKLGYEGVIISDALNMRSVSGLFDQPGELELEAFRAGCDLLCFTEHPWEAVELIEQQTKPERIDSSFRRVWSLKARGLKKAEESSGPIHPDHSLLREIADGCMTLVRGDEDSLGRIGEYVSYGTPQDTYFWDRLKEAHTEHENGEKVLALFPPGLRPSEQFGWESEVWEEINTRIQQESCGLILFGNPAALELLDWGRTQWTLLAFDPGRHFQEAAWRVYSGRAPARGKLPYTLQIPGS